MQNPIPSRVQFKWSRNLVASISSFGKVVTGPSDALDYNNWSSIATSKFGHPPSELNGPRGIAIDETTSQIYVADCYNNKMEIFSDTGEHISSLSTNRIRGQHGIAIHKDNLLSHRLLGMYCSEILLE